MIFGKVTVRVALDAGCMIVLVETKPPLLLGHVTPMLKIVTSCVQMFERTKVICPGAEPKVTLFTPRAAQ